MKQARCLLPALLLLAPVAAAQSMQSTQLPKRAAGTPSSTGATAPKISVELEPESFFLPGMQVRFDVTVNDPDGDPVSLTLANPLTGMRFAPVLDEVGPVTRRVTWQVSSSEGGLRRLIFEATDGTTVVRKSVPVHLTGPCSQNAILVEDVTGDGVPDIIASATQADKDAVDSGAIYVWDGTLPATQQKPSYTLTVPGATLKDQLAKVNLGQGIFVGDVTGDGIADIIAATPRANLNLQDEGALYLWKGGADMSAAMPPTATLSVTGAGAIDELGSASGVGVTLIDVTGDGIRDVVTASDRANGQAGAVYVWHGGQLAGAVDPTATLTGANSDQLTTTTEQGIVFADLNGDGLKDIVAASPRADVAGGIDNGAVYVWFSGAGLSGPKSADATFVETTAALTALGELRVGDFNADGIDDLVTDASGELLAFAGSPSLSGMTGATARLTHSLGGDLASSSGMGILLADVTGDGQDDVISMSVTAQVANATNAGAAFVWAGGSGLSGTLAPTAQLGLSSPVGNDMLGQMNFTFSSSQGLLVEDVTGDGVLDVIAGGPDIDRVQVINAGAVAIWSGGSQMSGARTPTALLVNADAVPGDNMGSDASSSRSGQHILFEDVTGDGLLDVVVAAPRATRGGLNSAGAIYIWRGGPALRGQMDPLIELERSTPNASDFLVHSNAQGIYLLDVTGDGLADVVTASNCAQVGAVDQAGAMFVFASAPGNSGVLNETAILAPGNSPTNAVFTAASGDGMRFADISGDGLLDLLGISGDPSVAAIHAWYGGPSLAGAPQPDLDLPAGVNTTLGNNKGQGYTLVNLDDDPELEVLAGASEMDFAAKQDAGGLLIWLEPLLELPAKVLRGSQHQSSDRLGT